MTTTPKPWQRLFDWNGTVQATEESIPFRVLVQLLVFVGIGATDQVAEQSFSLWAIPLSSMAAGWGWYARRQRNIPVKLMIAVAMIAALVGFLGDLVNATDETRILLCRLLIQVQVLHCFDLPRRKDLGYSIVIGFILIGVAATLSQTMAFGLWVVAFVAVVIPVLVLDLRSRLNVDANSWKLDKLGVSPSAIATLLGLVLIVGLVVFALLPRLPGYQVRTFPVSSELVQRQSPPGVIVNPSSNNNQGTENNNQSGNGAGSSSGGLVDSKGRSLGLPPLFGEQFDATRSVEVSPELVMRVRSQAALFWRVLSYDRYTGKGWQISRTTPEFIETLTRDPLNYKFSLPFRTSTLVLPSRTKEVVQTYTITTNYFPNLIPAAATPREIFFPSEELEIDPEGNLRAIGVLPLDVTYTVISDVPKRDVSFIQKRKTIYPRLLAEAYLPVPDKILPQIQNIALTTIENARNVVNGEPQTIDNPYDAALYLAQYLKQNYRLSPPGTDLDPDRDIVTQFLTTKTGSPTQFVSAYVLMLRSLGIPTRYAVGFAPGKFNPFTGYYEVMNTDTMSLGEVYFPGFGWLTFNPVPGMPLYPSSIEEDQTFGALGSFWKWIASFIPSPIAGFFAVIFSNLGKFLGGILTGLISWLNSLGWFGIFVGIFLLLLLGLGLWGLWQLASWWLYRLQLSRLHPVQRTYQQMIKTLQESGLPKLPSTTPREYATIVSGQMPPILSTIVWQITNVYQDWRYGNLVSLTPIQLRQLLRQLDRKDWHKMLYTKPKL